MTLDLVKRFEEALLSRAVKKVVPTDMSSAELEQLAGDVMERVFTSARTMSSEYLAAAEAQIRAILEPRSEDGRTVGQDRASARLELKKVWEALGYEAPEGKEGTIQDLSSDGRIDLVLDTNTDMARGFGQWRQGQSEEVLDLWPCQELFRAEKRIHERDWPTRFLASAAEVGDEAAAGALRKYGRMVARKDSAIWVALSRFKTPYPPFDFNSGMWTRDVDRQTSVELEVIGEWDRVTPQRRSFEAETMREAA